MALLVCVFVPPLLLVSRVLARRSAKTTAKRQRILGEIYENKIRLDLLIIGNIDTVSFP
jgi:hypothetical protein